MSVTRFHGDRQIEDGSIDKDDLNSTLQDEIDEKIIGDGTSKITVSGTTPSSPSDGDLWIDTSAEDPDSFGDLAFKDESELDVYTQSEVDALIEDSRYKVDDIYISVNSTDPATRLGYGTWTLFGEGRMLIGVNSSDSDIDAAEKTTGASTHAHDLSTGHAKVSVRGGSAVYHQRRITVPSWTYNVEGTGFSGSVPSGSQTDATELGGDTDSASSLPPAIAVYMWKRTA